MKKLIFLFSTIFFLNCNAQQQGVIVNAGPFIMDTSSIVSFLIVDGNKVDSKAGFYNFDKDSLILEMQRRIDSLKTQLFLAKYKIEKVKYYLAIVARKPSQSKYLRGWMIRAIK